MAEQYIRPWKNNEAEIELNGQRFILRHMMYGILGPRFYEAFRDGKSVVTPSKKISTLIRRLEKIAPPQGK